MWWDGNYVDWYAVAKDFQTLIAGLLGFSGVAVSIFLGGYFQRQQEKRRILHEASCIRSALYAELRVIAGAFAVVVDKLEKCPSEVDSCGLESFRYDVIYSDLKNDIGLLQASEVKSVVTSYVLYSSLISRFEFHAAPMKQGSVFIIKRESFQTLIEEIKRPLQTWAETLNMLEERM